MTRPTRYPPRRLGRRGSVLLILATFWVLFGVSVVGEPIIAPGAFLPHLLIPVPIRIGLWVGTGLIAAFYAWAPPERSDGIGYGALIFMPVVRSLSYLGGWAATYIGDPDDGYPRGLINAAFWGLVVLMVFTISGWQEERPPRRRKAPANE